MEKWKPISPQDVGEIIEGQTGYQPDLFEVALISQAMGGLIIEHLKEGGIPCLAKVSEDESEAEVAPAMEKDQLKALWRIFTEMTEDEMDKRIEESGLYKVD